MCLQNAVALLVKEAGRFAPDQGRIARRNGRRSVLGAIRQVRNALNEEFPQIELPKKGEKLFVIEVFAPPSGKRGKGRWFALQKVFGGTYHPYNPGYLNYQLPPLLRHRNSLAETMESACRGLPNRLFDKANKIRHFPFAKAAKYVKRLSQKFPDHVWRIRSGKDVLVTNIL